MGRIWEHIPVVRSLRDLGQDLPPEKVPLNQLGTTYTMAQQATWLDDEHFAVGRWDGSLSIFNKTTSATKGPVITTAVSAPADQGIQMLDWIAPGKFISSNDGASMVVWNSPSGEFQKVSVSQKLSYDSAYGIANCSTSQNLGNTLYIATGHENGYLLLWTADVDGSKVGFLQAIDLRSSSPLNPWGLQNIRGASWFLSDSNSIKVATGSENGEICVVDVPSGQVLSRTLYNPEAKRGINAISTAGQNLLVANCSVGSSDKNLWYYWIDGNDWSVTLRDSKNLMVDRSAPQVFNFDVTWGWYFDGPCFFSATEEGELWMGTIEGNRTLSILGHQKVAVADLGACLASGIGSVIYAAYNLSAFDTLQAPVVYWGDPNRIQGVSGALERLSE